MCDLVERLESALSNSVQRQQLLRERETLRNIMNDLGCRRWLIDQVALAESSDRTLVARSRKVRNLLVQMMQQSGSIRRQGSTDPEIYDEALALTLEWFCGSLQKNLSNYDPERGGFVTWFNSNLEYRIKDIIRDQSKEYQRRTMPFPDTEDAQPDPIEMVPAPACENPDAFWQSAIDLVQIDLQKTLETTRMQGHPHVNAKNLSLLILEQMQTLGEKDWSAVAKQLRVDEQPLKRFWSNTARPKLKHLLQINHFL